MLAYFKIGQEVQHIDETYWILSAKYHFIWTPSTHIHLRIMFHVGLSASAVRCAALPPTGLFIPDKESAVEEQKKMVIWTDPPQLSSQQTKHH